MCTLSGGLLQKGQLTDMLRVVFFGNHTVGVVTLRTLVERVEVVGVVAHPEDPEDGVRYESVFDYAKVEGLRALRARGKDSGLRALVRALSPDLIWVADYRYLLPDSVLSLASLGAVNIHPSLLPCYRGRASINWAILNGETELGLTAHYVDEGIDTGDIIDQVSYRLRRDQDVGDALRILLPLYAEMTDRVIGYFIRENVPRRKQDHERATAFPRRRPEDGRINWTRPAERVHNLIRAVAVPYPGAFTFVNGAKLIIWKAMLRDRRSPRALPGTIRDVDGAGVHVQCGQGSLVLKDYEVPGEQPPALAAGVRFSDG